MIRRFKYRKVVIYPSSYFTSSTLYGRDTCCCGAKGRFNNRISPCFESVWRYYGGLGIVKARLPYLRILDVRLVKLDCSTYTAR